MIQNRNQLNQIQTNFIFTFRSYVFHLKSYYLEITLLIILMKIPPKKKKRYFLRHCFGTLTHHEVLQYTFHHLFVSILSKLIWFCFISRRPYDNEITKCFNEKFSNITSFLNKLINFILVQDTFIFLILNVFHFQMYLNLEMLLLSIWFYVFNEHLV